MKDDPRMLSTVKSSNKIRSFQIDNVCRIEDPEGRFCFILQQMEKNAGENGYFICPDPELLEDLLAGIALNTERYGYGSCPCRVASGNETYDGDMICPCEYRDADVDEYGMCYCGLFVSEEIRDDPGRLAPIPERRPAEFQEVASGSAEAVAGSAEVSSEGHGDMEGSGKGAPPPVETRNTLPVWRCKVCGYLCARERPPPLCPICKAKAERFEIFGFG